VSSLACFGKLVLGGGGDDHNENTRHQQNRPSDAEDDDARDAIEKLCDGATSLDINKQTSGGGADGESAAFGDTLESSLRSVKKNDDPADDATTRVASTIAATEIVEAVAARYFRLGRAELALCDTGRSEELYARECRAVGSSGSWSWNASASLFSSNAAKRLGRDAPTLDEDNGVEDVRPTAEALVVSLCVRRPVEVAEAVLRACERSLQPTERVDAAAVDACYRAIGLIAPLLQQESQVIIAFPDLWRTRLAPTLTQHESYPRAENENDLVRARCLWLVARFRRAVFAHAPGDVTSLLEAVLRAVVGHANTTAFPSPRVALAAVDAACALFETAAERHRAVWLYAKRVQGGGQSPSDLALVRAVAATADVVQRFCGPVAERAVAVAQAARTPEGVLRCLQCAALCVEVATLENVRGILSDDDDDTGGGLQQQQRQQDEESQEQLLYALSQEIGLRLAPRAWQLFGDVEDPDTTSGRSDDERFATSRLRGAVLCLFVNTLVRLRRHGKPEPLIPLRGAALELVALLASDGDLLDPSDEDARDDAIALWLEVLRATPNDDEAARAHLDACFDNVFCRPHGCLFWTRRQTQSSESLLACVARYGTPSAPCGDVLRDDESVLAALHKEEPPVTTPLLTVLQAYVLRLSRSPAVLPTASGIVLGVLASHRAHDTSEVDPTTALAAFVAAELVVQTLGAEAFTPVLAAALRFASASPSPAEDDVFTGEDPRRGAEDPRFAQARATLVARAIVEARGDVFRACGFGDCNRSDPRVTAAVERALRDTCLFAARRTLDDLLAASRGAAPPPRRCVLVSLAAAAALGGSDEASANAAWATLPAIFRLWARVLFDFQRAAQSDPAAFGNWTLPPPPHSDAAIDAIAVAANRLQRNDLLYATPLLPALKQALAQAQRTRGVDGLNAAAAAVEPPELRNILLALLGGGD